MSEPHDGSPSQDPLGDEFIHALIESVQRNPCVYNRYDPLHKVADYKHEIWKMIGIEIGYDGQPVELERKWKHMRDKYVRLRKMDKQRAPIKTTNKWYNYYHKMSFLDPYVEHRHRKRQKEYLKNDEDCAFLDDVLAMKSMIKEEASSLGYESPQTSSSTSSAGLQNRSMDSPVDDDRLLLLYDKILGEKNKEKKSQILSNASNDWELLSDPKPPRKRVNQSKTTSTTSEKTTKFSVEDPLKDSDEDQVTLFIRSIAKTLVDMDRKKFAMARIEISKVLYNIEFGKIQYSENGAI